MTKDVANIRNGDLLLRVHNKERGLTPRLGIIVQERYRKRQYLIEWVGTDEREVIDEATLLTDFFFVPAVPIVIEVEEFNLDQE